MLTFYPIVGRFIFDSTTFSYILPIFVIIVSIDYSYSHISGIFGVRTSSFCPLRFGLNLDWGLWFRFICHDRVIESIMIYLNELAIGELQRSADHSVSRRLTQFTSFSGFVLVSHYFKKLTQWPVIGNAVARLTVIAGADWQPLIVTAMGYATTELSIIVCVHSHVYPSKDNSGHGAFVYAIGGLWFADSIIDQSEGPSNEPIARQCLFTLTRFLKLLA